MTTRRTTVAINFSKPGLLPPVYLAGSFSDPAWQPKPMEFTLGERNEHKFHTEIEVEEGMKYQYKFRQGDGNWLLDEDAPTGVDEMGNRNNLLAIPMGKKTESGDTQEPSAVRSTSKDATKKPSAETKGALLAGETSRPTLVVDKTDSAPRYGDNFGANATMEQREAHQMRASDAEPDQVIVAGDGADDAASNAAEVADDAANLDREPPTPPLTDEEAGRIGYRRLSQTPIEDVAAVASEVSESAALLDHEELPFKLQMPPPFMSGTNIDDVPLGSGEVTPWEDRVPLFAHESLECPPEEAEEPRSVHETTKPSAGVTIIDPNDPTIEEFPAERHLILDRVRKSAAGLGEEGVLLEGLRSSLEPSDQHGERSEASTSSPGLVAGEVRTPSLDSIPEELGEHDETPFALPGAMHHSRSHSGMGGARHGEREVLDTHKEEPEPTPEAYEPNPAPLQSGAELTHNTVAADPTAAGVYPQGVTRETLAGEQAQPNSRAISAGQTLDGAHMEPENIQLLPFPTLDTSYLPDDGAEEYGEAVPSRGGLTVTVHPATAGSSLRVEPSINTATTTTLSQENSASQLVHRKSGPPSPERPLTPNSMHSANIPPKPKNFLKNFLKLVFVDWVAALVRKLCGYDSDARVAVAVLIVVYVGLALYFWT